MEPQIAPYGSWKSPITTDLITGASIGLGQIALDGEDIYWSELRPLEKGRNVIVRRTPNGKTEDVTPNNFNVRTRVHEYGGAAYFVVDGTVYFSNFADQRLYRQTLAGEVQPLTAEIAMRYGDGILDSQRQRIICVCEDHTNEGEPTNKIIAIANRADNNPQILVSGNDFYTSPRLSPDGAQLAWLTWNHQICLGIAPNYGLVIYKPMVRLVTAKK